MNDKTGYGEWFDQRGELSQFQREMYTNPTSFDIKGLEDLVKRMKENLKKRNE
jgi:hypothetical protein